MAMRRDMAARTTIADARRPLHGRQSFARIARRFFKAAAPGGPPGRLQWAAWKPLQLPGRCCRWSGCCCSPRRWASLRRSPWPGLRCCWRSEACRGLGGAGFLELVELQHLDPHVRLPGLLGLLAVLLPACLLEGPAHVGVEARTVAERRVEDVFHAVSPTLTRDCSSRRVPTVHRGFSLTGLEAPGRRRSP